MYEDIGKKIKLMAKVGTIVQAVVCVIVGIILIAVTPYLIGLGFLIILLGPVLAWLNSFMRYGFGELVDKIYDIERKVSVVSGRGGQSQIDPECLRALQRLRALGTITEEEYQDAIQKMQGGGV